MCVWERGVRGGEEICQTRGEGSQGRGNYRQAHDARWCSWPWPWPRHETMHPLVNHLMNASGSISRPFCHARNPTNQLPFNCSIQWTTKRRRSSGDFTGKSLAFSVSSMGRACRGFSRSAMAHIDKRVAPPPPKIGRKENTDHGHPETEVVRVGRHGTVSVTESVQSLNDPRRRSALDLVQKGETDVN